MKLRAALGVASLVAAAGCPHHDHKPKDDHPPVATDARTQVVADGGAVAAIALPDAPPLPPTPAGLPTDRDDANANPQRANAAALGELLFYDARLAMDGKTSCATCHDPAHDYAGRAHQVTASGAPNLRRAPALVNLAWRTQLGWDGRYASLAEQLPAHIKGQLGNDLAAGIDRLASNATYAAHVARLHAAPADAAALALQTFVETRYDGDAPWDRVERSHDVPAELKAGYALFTGKAQCSVCHTPPLYTDNAFHKLGVIASHDEGRGRVDPAQAGAFATPTLRGAANRTAFFHDGSAPTLDAAIDWHLAGGVGQGAAASLIDPALKPIVLTADERAQLGAFVRALSTTSPAPTPPVLP